LSLTPGALRCHAPELGEHTDEILSEIGINAGDQEIFREKGVI
jgi:crotonobetainyl-CoA:carnitine CoA-transferase CaiB-like acyl-CoA transferase